MLTRTANRDSRLSLWLRVREFAVPPSMIDIATARRHTGDWAGACAAARVDVDLDLRSVARAHGRELAARVRDDLRHLAPDLLRWHMPRIAPDGLLRPGLTMALARYDDPDGAGDGSVYLVARTPPAWADAGQRISLMVWDGTRRAGDAERRRYPHPHPDRRFRLDLHRHLWDARRSGELRIRSGADRLPADDPAESLPEPLPALPAGRSCAVDRWAAEAGIVLRAEGRSTGTVTVRIGVRHRLALDLIADRDDVGPPALRISVASAGAAESTILPDAATWVPPDLDLIRAGAIDVDRLHPLVGAALAADHAPTEPSRTGHPTEPPTGRPRPVECRGARHRIGLVDGVLVPLDHDPAEIRREELLAALTGTPLPCLRVIDEVHRRPECLTGVRERLDHGDFAGALTIVEGLLGPDALLRAGALRDELATAAQRRIVYGLFRAGLTGPGPRPDRRGPRRRRSH
ncbi:hypothetical protein OG948_42460 (plasmid) [Embleya sp. NBC_00888]|uniref:hypothetical protein n=1 Tax=Embleya sp. NBC_00888 TaxID=2975960 RepID=UPI002F90FA7C|nr:hypothetical protein OG948_42460 [Embleya sp. NBC_00888]